MSTATREGAVDAVRIVHKIDDSPDLSYLDDPEKYKGDPKAQRYIEQDRRRLAEYGRSWWAIGIWAEADVVIGGVVQKIQSGGLWGIESDSGERYLNQIRREEYRALVEILRQMGARSIPAFKHAVHAER